MDTATLHALLRERFGPDAPAPPEDAAGFPSLGLLAAHRSCRAFRDAPVSPALLELVLAAGFCAPSKSDLQQRDVVVVQDPALRRALDALVPAADWLPTAPVLLVVCGDNRRQRRLHELRGHPFANDHLDALFNAATDAAILLAWLVVAAEAAGLGCCPLSALRNEAQAVSDLLGLPAHVFPYAGLALGWPAGDGAMSPRLPLAATVHRDRYDDSDLPAQVEDADRRRAARKPFTRQRAPGRFGTAASYSWSEDVTRQYARPERAGFGAYIRGRGFRLD